jgi:ribosomal protein S16
LQIGPFCAPRGLAEVGRLDIIFDSHLRLDRKEHAMAVKLRLKRQGRKNHPFYRLNAINSQTPRDGRVIEELGFYDPLNKDKAKQFVAKLDRCTHWLNVGAIPSETVSSLLKKSGIEHKSLRLPRPGKPKPVVAEGEKKEA